MDTKKIQLFLPDPVTRVIHNILYLPLALHNKYLIQFPHKRNATTLTSYHQNIDHQNTTNPQNNSENPDHDAMMTKIIIFFQSKLNIEGIFDSRCNQLKSINN